MRATPLKVAAIALALALTAGCGKKAPKQLPPAPQGEGEVIEYDSKADNVKFIKRAEMRRYRGAAINDEMTGNVIVYDNSTDVFTVDSGAARGAPAVAGGRIRAMLTPGSAASAPAVPAPAPTPSPQLRPSTTMGGEKK